VETRADSGPAFEVCRRLDHAQTRAAVTAERAVLATLGGGCQVPIGAHARVEDGQLQLDAVVVAPDGSRAVRRRRSGAIGDAVEIGRTLGEELLNEGAREILEMVYG
jgi:hydroxymethylbilane synthase